MNKREPTDYTTQKRWIVTTGQNGMSPQTINILFTAPSTCVHGGDLAGVAENVIFAVKGWSKAYIHKFEEWREDKDYKSYQLIDATNLSCIIDTAVTKEKSDVEINKDGDDDIAENMRIIKINLEKILGRCDSILMTRVKARKKGE